ncbi:MAG: hypothetical protein E6F99_24005 [Actinobacteria bacterium]|nr:MAG: hypothetical protein E6F99_24005 [Actinomycetota bacterium]
MITGFADFADGSGRIPVRYVSGKAQFIDPQDVPGTGYAVSQKGNVIVGNDVTGGVQRALLVGLGRSGFLHLPSIVCCGPSAAWAVRNYGQWVFGNSDAGNGRTHPTMWTVHPGGPIGTLIATPQGPGPDDHLGRIRQRQQPARYHRRRHGGQHRGTPGAPQGAGAGMPFVWDKLDGLQHLFD